MPNASNYIMHDQMRNQVLRIMNINLARLDPLNAGLRQLFLESPTTGNRIRVSRISGSMKPAWIKQAAVELGTVFKALGSDLKAAIL